MFSLYLKYFTSIPISSLIDILVFLLVFIRILECLNVFPYTAIFNGKWTFIDEWITVRFEEYLYWDRLKAGPFDYIKIYFAVKEFIRLNMR